VSKVCERFVLFLVRRHDRVAEGQPAPVGQQHEPDTEHEPVLRFRVAVAGMTSEVASLLTTGVIRDRNLAAVGEADTAAVEKAGQLLLHRTDQLDQPTESTVVLRLIRQMRKPARQDPLDEAEELPVGADPDSRLTDRQRDQLAVRDQRRTATPGRDPIVVSENVACNNKGFQIRHLELQSRGDTGLEALLRHLPGPCQPDRLSHQPSSRWAVGLATLPLVPRLRHTEGVEGSAVWLVATTARSRIVKRVAPSSGTIGWVRDERMVWLVEG